MTEKEKWGAGEVSLVWILALLSGFGPLSTDTTLPLLPTLARELSAAPGAVQMTLSAFFVGFAIGQMVYGPFSDRFGRRPLLVLGTLVYAVTSVLSANSNSIETLIWLRFLQALGGSAGTVIARAVIRDRFDTVRGARAMSYMMLIAGLAPLIAPLVGATLLEWFGWRAIFWGLAAFGVACLLTVLVGLPESNPPERRSRGNPLLVFVDYARVLAHRPTLASLLSCGIGFGGLFAYLSGMPFVLIEFFGLSPREFALMFAINIVGLMLGSYLNGRLVTALGVKLLFVIGTSVAALAGLALWLSAFTATGGLVGIAVPLFFYLSSLSLILVNAITLASAKFPEKAGAVAALFGGAQFGIGSLAGLAVGRWHDGTPVPMAVIIAGCGVTSFLLVWFAHSREA